MGLGSFQRLVDIEPRMKDLNSTGNLHMEDCGVQPGHGCGGVSVPSEPGEGGNHCFPSQD